MGCEVWGVMCGVWGVGCEGKCMQAVSVRCGV